MDYLVTFCEYVYNLLVPVSCSYFLDAFGKDFYFDQINRIIESIGYESSVEDSFTIFVPKDNVTIEVSKSTLIPENISYKVIAYNHHSKKGSLNEKKEIIIKLADLLESSRMDLKKINNQFESDLFFLFNTCNIRHNNVDSKSTKYKETIANLSSDELENWYDEIFQMCLLAFMQLEHQSRTSEIRKLKQ